MEEAIFATHAPALAALGIAVVPISRNRTPHVAAFNGWLRAPSNSQVTRWGTQWPAANIALVPRLSGVFVADVDALEQVGAVEELLGVTPLHVLTNRGAHLYYSAVNAELPGSLRGMGLDVDLKAGANLVIVPPSIHESGVRYRFRDGSDWLLLRKLPKPNLEKIVGLVRSAQLLDARNDSRAMALNDELCRLTFSSEAEMLQGAIALNPGISEKLGKGPMDHAEVAKTVKKVWNDRVKGKITPYGRGASVFRSPMWEWARLSAVRPKYASDAFFLLARLRTDHGARCKRGETFAITPVAMARGKVIPGWTRERYERARNILLEAGLITLVSGFSNAAHGRQAAQYRLA